MLSGTWENECGEGEGAPGRGWAWTENCVEPEEGAGPGSSLTHSQQGLSQAQSPARARSLSLCHHSFPRGLRSCHAVSGTRPANLGLNMRLFPWQHPAFVCHWLRQRRGL